MIKQIIQNINTSELSLAEKEDFINYAETIASNKCPIIFESNQIKTLFNLPDGDIEKFMITSTNHYYIKKRNGDLREVWQPNYQLKIIQKWILKNILYKIDVSTCAHGFVKNKSILTNAEIHCHQDPFWVFSTDIQEFFPSIDQCEIKKIYKNVGYSDGVSDALSRLTTVNNRLVQGFPTSPMLSNIYFRPVDEELQKIASQYNIHYSRYADDITFSGGQKKGYLTLIKKLKQIIFYVLSKYGFIVNEEKTRFMKNKHTKIVTGLVVTSKGVKVPQKYIRKLNKELYYCQKFGVNEHLKYHGLITIANYKGYLTGLARFIYMVDQPKGARFLEKIQALNWD
jgi:RNA-directed DNA polymerase